MFPSFYPKPNGLAAHSGRSQISLPGPGRARVGSSLQAFGRDITLLQLEITGQRQPRCRCGGPESCTQANLTWQEGQKSCWTSDLRGSSSREDAGSVGGWGGGGGTAGKANNRERSQEQIIFLYQNDHVCMSFTHL